MGEASIVGLLFVEESKESLVDLVVVGPPDVVRPVVDAYQAQVLDERREAVGGGIDGQDPVLGSVYHEHRYVDVGQVVAEVGQPGVDAGVRGER
jgi:hypothetical protein